MMIAAEGKDREILLGSIVSVLTTNGRDPQSSAGEEYVHAFDRHVLGSTEVSPVASVAVASPSSLAAAMGGDDECELVAEALALSALVDQTLDPDRIDVVLAYVEALGVSSHWVEDLALSRDADLTPVINDMGARNLESVTDGRLDLSTIEDVSAWLLPYGGDDADPSLAGRYHDLQALPATSFGRAFFDFYDHHGFAFPGEPGAVNEVFSTPHDATHLLSGYDTSPQGELLVSTFTSQMHPIHPFEGHVLPVIYSWHLGIEFNTLAGSYRGAFDPAKFWVAWNRGAAARSDTFSTDFEFWDHVESTLAEVADDFAIPPLAPEFRAHSTAIAGVDYHPIA